MALSDIKSKLNGQAVFSATFLLTCFTINFQVVAMNIIDTNVPIVIYEDIAGRHSGNLPNHSYFGYSLTFMKDLTVSRTSPSSEPDTTARLFIGAPKENRASTINHGVVWHCKFQGNGTNVACSVLSHISNIPSNKNEECAKRAISIKYPENDTDQWIGATLNVVPSTNQLLTCAPRYKMNSFVGLRSNNPTCSTDTALTGTCYLGSVAGSIQQLDPFNPLSEAGNRFTYIINDNLNLYTEFGMSSHITQSENFLIGNPFTITGRGVVVHYQKNMWNSPQIYYNWATSHDYFGYSVTSGRTHGNKSYSAFGAPRGANLFGVVSIFAYDVDTKYYRHTDSYEGEHFGSYFGYALTTADLNGDGNDKLLVGAPLYSSDFSTEAGHSTGCVLIYDVSQHGNRKPLDPKLCMNSKNVSMGSRFGSAICKLGDINFDHKEDFAISAPYDDEGIGTVFIYHGGERISDIPAQVIRGKSMRIPNLQGFGTNLLSGKLVDIDGNGTPDLVVSSFESRHVVILRSRPVAKVSITFSFHGNEGVQLTRLNPNLNSFVVRVCTKLEFLNNMPPESNLDAWLNLEVDMSTIEKRAYFANNHQAQIELPFPVSARNMTCLEFTLKRLQDFVEDTKHLQPIEFIANFKYNETEADLQSNVQHATILLNKFDSNNQNQQYQTTYGSFNPYLPAPISPNQNERGYVDVGLDDCGNDTCDPQLNLDVELFYEQTDGKGKGQEKLIDGSKLVIGQVDSVIISIKLSNQNQTAYRPTIRVTFSISDNFDVSPSLLQLDWRETPGKHGQCNDTQQGETSGYQGHANISLTLLCIGSLHKGKKSQYLLAIGNLKHLKMKTEQRKGSLKVWVDAFPDGNEVHEKVSHSIVVPLEGDVAIYVESSVLPMAQRKIDPIVTNLIDLTQIFLVKNLGFSATAVNMLRAEVLIPTYRKLRGGNWTGAIGIANPSSSGVHCDPVNFKFYDPSNIDQNEKQVKSDITISTQTQIRKTRSPLGSLPQNNLHNKTLVVPEISEKFITLTGCEGDAKVPAESCKKIKCSMDLPSKESHEIPIQMYILQGAKDQLIAKSTKGIRIDSVISVFYFNKKVMEKVGTAQREFHIEKTMGAWIFLVSGAAGVIVLLLTTFGLFKCGFFRRKVKEDLKQLKRRTIQMQQIDMSTLLAINTGSQEDE